jgi:hypothetical protein
LIVATAAPLLRSTSAIRINASTHRCELVHTRLGPTAAARKEKLDFAARL